MCVALLRWHHLLFLASAASTDVLQQQLLLHSATVATTDAAVSLAKNIWSSAVHNSPLPTGLSAHKVNMGQAGGRV